MDALKTREEIEKLINTNVFITTKGWLEAAATTNATVIDLERLEKARKRVLQYPGPEVLPEGVLMDYNPITGLVQFHSDEKLIFLLSSDPNEVIGKIVNFTESDETVLSINRLAGTVMQFKAAVDSVTIAETNAQLEEWTAARRNALTTLRRKLVLLRNEFQRGDDASRTNLLDDFQGIARGWAPFFKPAEGINPQNETK